MQYDLETQALPLENLNKIIAIMITLLTSGRERPLFLLRLAILYTFTRVRVNDNKVLISAFRCENVIYIKNALIVQGRKTPYPWDAKFGNSSKGGRSIFK